MHKTTTTTRSRAHHNGHAHNGRLHHHVSKDIRKDMKKVKAALARATRGVRGKAGSLLNESIDTVRERSEAAQDDIAMYVAKKPFKSLGLAVLAGAVFSILLRR